MRSIPSLISLTVIGFVMSSLVSAAEPDPPRPIAPEEARRHVDQRVRVEFLVRHAKHSTKRQLTYLDSETDFMDPRNLGVVLTEQARADLRKSRGITDPVEHYRDRRIRVVGVVILESDRPYIKVNAAEAIELLPDPPRP